MSTFGEAYAAFQMEGADPSDEDGNHPERCGNCGSTAIWWDNADGWCCDSCGATDADEP